MRDPLLATRYGARTSGHLQQTGARQGSHFHTSVNPRGPVLRLSGPVVADLVVGEAFLRWSLPTVTCALDRTRKSEFPPLQPRAEGTRQLRVLPFDSAQGGPPACLLPAR